MVVPGFHQPTTATAYVQLTVQHTTNCLPTSRPRLPLRRVRFRPRCVNTFCVTDTTALAKYQAKGCEIIRFSPADVAAARPKAMAAWRTATKGDALTTKILDSQVAFMKELGLLA